jgi:exodeoxyribonuclease VII small subunit
VLTEIYFRTILKIYLATCQAKNAHADDCGTARQKPANHLSISTATAVAYNAPVETHTEYQVPTKTKNDDVEQCDLSTFESHLNELEQLVERMEQGDQTLEQSLEDFERGVALTRACEKTLRQAEQRVEQLVKKHGEMKLEPFSCGE